MNCLCLMIFLAAEEFHDIAPPVDYSLLPTWVIFCGAFVALVLMRSGRLVAPTPLATSHSRNHRRASERSNCSIASVAKSKL